MPRLIDITGHRFGRIVAIRFSGKNKHGQRQYLFKCDCGNEKIIDAHSVKRGKTSSCGCFSKESLAMGHRWKKQTHEERAAETLLKHIVKTDTCWVWKGRTNKKGYGIIGFRNEDGRMAHRVAWILKNGEIPEGLCVCHKCDNPPCVNPDHLFLGTNQENIADRHAKGRSNAPRGEQHGMSVLNDHQVKQIQSDPRPSRQVGKTYGISKTHVLRIKKGESWKALN